MDVSLARSAVGKLGPQLGAGGQAVVFSAPRLKLPGVRGALVYKQYRADQSPPAGLAIIAAHRTRLDDRSRAVLDEIAAWPLRVVHDDGAVCGVVVPRIPDGYVQKRVLPGSGRRSADLREIQNLFVDPKLAARLGMPCPTGPERLALCRDFARGLHFLHRRELVFGDINAKNAVFRLGDQPSIMLVDCDAVRVKGSMAVVRQLNAPDWNPPEGDVLSQETDRYKFGLFVLRCLAPGSMASVGRDPDRARPALDAEGMSLLARSLSTRAGERPTLRDWGRYLHWRVTGQRIAPASGGAASRSAVPAARTAPPAGGRLRRDPGTGKWITVV